MNISRLRPHRATCLQNHCTTRVDCLRGRGVRRDGERSGKGFASWRAGFVVLAALSWLLSVSVTQGAEKFFDFGQTQPGKLPAGFRATLTGKGKPSEWKVVLDDVPAELAPLASTKPRMIRRAVLAQVSRDPTDERFPQLIYEEERFTDFTFTTRFNLVEGVIEQMAGVVFRWQNESNYYVVRASGLGNNVRFYKFVDGVRSEPIGPSVPIPTETWHELSVNCLGNKIRVQLNGKEIMPVMSDYSFAQGRIGFWTKSDSISHFLDAKVDYVPVEILAKKLVRAALEDYPRVLQIKLFGHKPGVDGVVLLAGTGDAPPQEAGGTVESNVLEKGVSYYGKEGNKVTVTIPVRDRNGDSVAALRVEMKAFPGQTEQNALVRALPIAKHMEKQFQSAKDLVE